MAILADVAPYSRQYNTYCQRVGRQAQNDTKLEIEYEKILTRVKKTREPTASSRSRTRSSFDLHTARPSDQCPGALLGANCRTAARNCRKPQD